MASAVTISVSDLTPRQIDVVILIGRDDLRYQAAAAKMRNRGMRWTETEFDDLPTISPRTVQQYAAEIRDLIGSDDVPTRALRQFYQQNREELEALT